MASNLNFFAPWVSFADEVSQLLQDMLWTPETSGGLLVAVHPDRVETFQTHCESAVVVGEVHSGDGHLRVSM